MTKQACRLLCFCLAVLAAMPACAPSSSQQARSSSFQPVRAVCGRAIRTSPDTLTALAHLVRRIANSDVALEEKAQQLRDTLPDHDTFLGVYGDLCWLATFGQIADTEYHHLLDVLPLLARSAPSPLLAPTLSAPADDVVFDYYPRRTTLQWGHVDGAARYLVEVEIRVLRGAWQPQVGLPPNVTAATEFVFDFDGANPGRWRVRAVDSAGNPGPPSEWRRFVYLR